jgi:hypothetical protein
LRVRIVVSRLLLIVLGLLVATLFAPTAKADGIYLDFACSGVTACGQNQTGGQGTVTASGGNFSTTGITVTEGSGFYPAGSLFTLTFDTSTSMISIIGQGSLSGEVFNGMITNLQTLTGNSTTDINFTAIWPTIPADVQSLFNTTGGWDSGFTIFLSTSGTANSVDVTITPAPEPAAPVLLSAGLLGLGLLLKRRAFSLT